MYTAQLKKFDINKAMVHVSVRFPLEQGIPSSALDSLQKYLYKNIVMHRKITSHISGEGIDVMNKAVNLAGKSFWITYGFSSCEAAMRESPIIAELIDKHIASWKTEERY